MRYSVDTSSLIHAWTSYPIESFGGLWDRIVGLIEDGEIAASSFVLEELRKRDDDLLAWARGYRVMFLDPTEHVQRSLTEIINDHPGWLDEGLSTADVADPWVIALARVNELCVVTEEKAGGSVNRPKIPTVCRGYDTPCTDLLGLIKSERWRFD